MKLSLVIMVVSALFLSAANVGTQSAINHRTAQPNRSSQSEQNKTPEPIPTAQPSPHAVSSHAAAEQGRQQKPKPHRFIYWITSITAQGFFNFLVMVSTVAMAIFTYQLVRANRPFLIFEKQALSAGFHPHRSVLSPEEQANPVNFGVLTAQVTVRNAGNGPAVIHSAVGLLIVAGKPPKPCRFSRYRECRSLFVSKRIFPPDEFAELVSSGFDARELSQEEYEAVRDDKLRIFFYGRVKYRSMLGGRFRSDFYYVFLPPHGVFTNPYMAAVREYNRP